jgi:hypothetical protein
MAMFKLKNQQSYNRRKSILSKMEKLKDQEISCAACSGKCCTSVANSMQCSPLEAMEILNWLKEKNLWHQEMKQKLDNCIRDYRLDYEIPTSRGLPLRRTYTCPFFNHGPKGCLLSRTIKPYGCLAFNPKSKKISNGEDCISDILLLGQRDNDWNEFEKLKNDEIKLSLSLDWDKLPMPIALLDLDKKIVK